MITQGQVVIGSVANAAGSKPQIIIYDHAGTALDGAAWVVPEWESVDIAQNATESTTQNYEGNYVAIHWHGAYLEVTVRVVPFGTTAANARLAASLIVRGYTARMTGLPVITAGAFVDALNVTTETPALGTLTSHRWIIVSDSVSLRNAGAAGKSITMRRYPNIPGGAAITS